MLLSLLALAFVPALAQAQIVKLQPSAAAFAEGITHGLSLNCTFKPGQTSLAFLSIIMSKSSSPTATDFQEVATLTLAKPDSPNIKNALGADVTGHLQLTGESKISFVWKYPTHEVAGQWRCLLTAVDIEGHPVASSDDVTLQKQQVTPDLLLKEVQACAAQRDNLTSMVGQENSVLTNTVAHLQTANSELAATRLALNKSEEQLAATKAQLAEATLKMQSRDMLLYMIRSGLYHTEVHFYNGHLYVMARPQVINVTQYQKECQQLGGYLVEFQDELEWNSVTSFLLSPDSHTSVRETYIGLTDSGHQGRWTLLTDDSSAAMFTRWSPGQPDGVAGEDCVVLLVAERAMKDYDCTTTKMEQQSFLCEIPVM